MYPQIASELSRVEKQINATDDKAELQAIATQAWTSLKKKI